MTAKDVSTESRGLSAIETFPDYLARRIEEDAERGIGWGDEQLEAILTAGTLEEMWNADELDSTAGKDIPDLEMRINEVVFRSGNKYDHGILLPSGERAYVLVKSQRLDNGKEFVWNTSAKLIIGKIRWLEAANLLGTEDAECLIKPRETANGNEVLKLRPIPGRAIKSSVES